MSWDEIPLLDPEELAKVDSKVEGLPRANMVVERAVATAELLCVFPVKVIVWDDGRRSTFYIRKV